MLESLALILCALAAPSPSLPEFTGERVVVAGVPDVYASVRARIQRVERGSRQSYWVVVVDSTGEGERATLDAVDELGALWQDQAARKGLEFDADRSIIILLAIESRQIAVRPGTVLQDRFGLRGDRISDEIVRPSFVPHARAGNFARGLEALVEATEAWIRARETPPPDVAATTPPPVRQAPPATRVPLAPSADSTPRRAVTAPTTPTSAAPVRSPAATVPRDSSAASSSLSVRTTILSLVGIALGALALVVVALRVVNARARRRVRRRLDSYRAGVVELLSRLDQLEQRHRLLPFTDEDFTEPMTGKTLELYGAVEERHAEIKRAWLTQMEASDRAQHLAAVEGLFGTRKLAEAAAVLDNAPGVEEQDERYRVCVEQLETLEAAHERATTALAAADARYVAAGAAIEKIGALELATVRYEPERQGCAAELERAREALARDPIGVSGLVAAVRERLDAVVAWTGAVVAAHEGACRALEFTDSVAALAREKRAGGLALREEGADPDPLLARARNEHAAALRALDLAEAEAASRHVEAARTLAEEARVGMERQEAAKELCADRLPRARAAAAALRRLAVEAGGHRETLEREHAAASWSGVATNVGRATVLLDGHDPLLDDAERASTSDEQRYLHAASVIEHVERSQDDAGALLGAVGMRLSELGELRSACRGKRDELESRLAEVERYVAEHERLVGDDARSLLDVGRENVSHGRRHADASPPHWPAAWQAYEQGEDDLRAALELAREDVTSHACLVRELDVARHRAGDVQRLLESSTADRVAANTLFAAASDRVADLAARLSGRAEDWSARLVELRRAAGDLERAEELAREDMRLARQAEVALDAARRECRRATGFYELGITADTGAVSARLDEADLAGGDLDYERCIALAAAAESLARAALDDAASRARSERRRRERARRRREAQRSNDLFMAGSMLSSALGSSTPSASSSSSHSSFGSSSSSSSSTSWSSSSGSSSTSWSSSSGSSQTSW